MRPTVRALSLVTGLLVPLIFGPFLGPFLGPFVGLSWAIAPLRAETTVPTITWDRWGVPHVEVPDLGTPIQQLRALGRAFGYATARDRLYQLELTRRTVTGRLSELVFARDLLARDVAARRIGLTDAERTAAVRRLPGRQRLLVRGFVDGVNRYLAELRDDPASAPAQFFFPGLDPSRIEPWRPEDVAALAEGAQAFEFGANELRNAVALLDLLERFPAAEARGIFDDLFWLEDPSAPVTADASVRPPALTRFAAPQMALLQRYAPEMRAAADALVQQQRLLGLVTPASNAVAVSGRLTASGAPILLGGAQVGLRLPNTYHEIGLRGAHFDATLFVPPSNVALGRTPRTAWTATSSLTDTVDWYVERLNPIDPEEYRHDGAWRRMSCRDEVFVLPFEPAYTEHMCRTVHGPVLVSFPESGVAFAQRRYTSGRELSSAMAMLQLGSMTGWRRFRRQADRIELSLNVLYAGADGHIGFLTRGALPVRPGRFDPRLPLPGTGEADTRRVLTGRALPSAVDPKQGWFAQWNNKAVRGWSAAGQRELWGTADRVQALMDRAERAATAAMPIRADDVARWMREVATSDLFAASLFPYLDAAVAAVPDTAPDAPVLRGAALLIAVWIADGAPLRADASGDIPYPGLTIYRAWREAVQAAVFADELGDHNRGLFYFQRATLTNWDDSGLTFTPDALLLRALEGPDAALPTSRDYLADVTLGTNPGRDAVLLAALRSALTALVTRFGSVEMMSWLTPRIDVRFFDDAGSDLYYGPTVVERADRGAFNFLVELAPGAPSWAVLPPGNSGFIPVGTFGARNLNDQLALYDTFGWRGLTVDPDEWEFPLGVEEVPWALPRPGHDLSTRRVRPPA